MAGKSSYKWNSGFDSSLNRYIQSALRVDILHENNLFGGASKGIGTGYGGMDALTALQNIYDSHGCDLDDLVEAHAWNEAELREEAIAELGAEDLLDMQDLAEEIQEIIDEIKYTTAEDWLSGTEYIPEDVLYWAFYEESDHNR